MGCARGSQRLFRIRTSSAGFGVCNNASPLMPAHYLPHIGDVLKATSIRICGSIFEVAVLCSTGAVRGIVLVCSQVSSLIDVSLAFVCANSGSLFAFATGLDHTLVVLNSPSNADGSTPEKSKKSP